MKKENNMQMSLFNETDMLFDVIAHFIAIQPSIDPVWWLCRWSDMVVFTVEIQPNQKAKGCMSGGKEYPFNVWEFVKQANEEEFVEKGISQSKVKCNYFRRKRWIR